MEKVFIFGIDGAMPECIFEEWIDELPTIKKLMQQGCYAKLNSSIPPLSGAAWTSIVTGKSPSDTGIFEYIYRRNYSYNDFHVITSNNIKEKTIWQIASNKKSIICFVPLTWPIKPFDGILISGFMTPPGFEIEFTNPKELKKEINYFLGEPLLIDVPTFRNLSKKEIIKQVYKVSSMHLNSIKYLLKNKKWDLFFSVINGSDRINHSFWRYFDKKHRKFNPDSEFKEVLKNYYKFIDKKLGELIKLLDKNTRIIILSDHGITRMHNRINLNDWLVKEGYLILKYPIKEKCKLKWSMVDWKKTKVFAVGAYDGEIFINLKGREPQGIVKKENYEELINELEIKFKKIKGDDNKILNTKVFVKKRDYSGKFIDIAPDMIIYFDDLEYGVNTSLIGNSSLWSPQTAIGSDDAAHSQQGIFIMNKSKQKGNIGEINIIDVAPTILNKLNIPIPKDMKGKIID